MMGQAMSFSLMPRSVRAKYGSERTFRERLAEALHRTGESIKEIASAADRTPKAAEHWLSGANEMSATTLIRLAAQYDEVWAEVREMCGRADDEAKAVELFNEFSRRWLERS